MHAAGSGPEERSNGSGRIESVVANWTSSLIDLSRRNNLLYFRQLRTGTLDLGDADTDARGRLFAGERMRASALYPGEEAIGRARRSLIEIQRKIRLLAEERGIDAGYVALGLASWPAPQGPRGTAPTHAPIILRPLTVTAKGINAADFELQLGESGELNPVLVYALGRQAGVDTAGLSEDVDPLTGDRQLEKAISWLGERAAAARVPVEFEEKLVAGVFAYEKLPMVRDLEQSTALLARHPLTAALAGDPDALDAVRRRTAQQAKLDVNRIEPTQEHLVIDADPSQQAAIATILNGSDLIVQGPPGTGKSQTIANLIAEATARGKKVLFVAQKRAAIDAVVANLRRSNLGDIVLDLHDPKTSRRAVAEQLKTSLDQAGKQSAPDLTEVNRTLTERRSRVMRHTEVMRRRREPAGMSIAEMEQQLLQLPPGSDRRVTLPRRALDQIPATHLRAMQDELARFVDADGLRWWRGGSPWSNARQIVDQDALRSTRASLDELTGAHVHEVRRVLDDLIEETGLRRPHSVSEWGLALGLMVAVEKTIATYGNAAFDDELDDRRAAFSTRAWRTEVGAVSGFWQRRKVRSAVKAARAGTAPRATVFEELSAAVEQRDRWRSLSITTPAPPPSLSRAMPRYEALRDNLAAIGAAAVIDGLTDRPDPDVDRALRALKDDERTLLKLPLFNRHRAEFERFGLAPLVTALATSGASATDARNALTYAWLSSWLRELRVDVPEYGGFVAAAQDRVVHEFCEADRRHIELAASRVRRAAAERQIAARDRWPEQRALVNDQVARKRGHKPIRDLVEEAENLLLAVRPCWAMSPLVVSQVLPPRVMFDLVVFDEASQIEPADAIPAIMRGSTVVVAGDNKQLPPTPFFATTGSDDGEDMADDLRDFESILDVLSKLLPAETLAWHYRSQDERLIEFSNRKIYNSKLVTFPGTARESALRHVLVDGPIPPGTKAYGPAEVERVVQLVLQHAAHNAEDSLGVITLGASGAKAIDARLRQELAARPELSAFFDPDKSGGQRFFVKSIENVQGDERDTIILAVDVSRTATGGVSHNFGPINQGGGERRLNVAVTRARKALTVVSTFTHNDLIPEKLTSEGMRFLHEFLRFSIEQSASPTTSMSGDVSPISRQVAERLRRVGVTVHPQYGVGKAGIDVAVEHPDQPGRMHFAIETDGAPYYQPERSVRERDRLRPQQLTKMGWRHRRVWTADWLQDPDGLIEQLLADLESARQAGPIAVQPSPDDPPPEPTSPPPERRLPRPRGLVPGAPIKTQPSQGLVALARWIDSDGLLRDEEQMIEAMMTELHYLRRGKNIVVALQAAIRTARRQRGA
ncbi:AAA domain-containing protein [Pseudonocardia sp. CA-107938]|uniref:AAA domain-containing protein n=1 Tax=Pseudonocardia sp. CA-107938 TaxID=3240021 RepID=UPI003D93359F